MNIWDVLKIEQTKDKDALKKAYRMRLSSVNPEDDPEGFMELRKAYEEAVHLADQTEEEFDVAIPDTPEQQMLASLEALYDDYARRINPDEWLALFNSDYFVSLDTSEDALYGLLRFLMNHVLVPKKVWKCIVGYFDLEGRRSELAEQFPENYLDYITNNATYEDIINYEAFEHAEITTSATIDAYIRDYIELDRMVRSQELKDAGEKIRQMKEKYYISNVYIHLEEMRIRLQTCRLEFSEYIQTSMTEEERKTQDLDALYAERYASALAAIREEAEGLSAKYPDDITLLHFCGDVCILNNDLEQAEQYFNRSKELDPQNYLMRAKQAELAFRKGDYKAARDGYMDLLKENHYDDSVRIGMVRANQMMIQENLEKLKKNPDDIQAKMDVGWSYYQSYQFQEAIAFLTKFQPEGDRKFEYYNVLGRCYLGVRDYAHARQCFLVWKNLIEQLPEEDTSAETEKKRVRYPYVNFLIADCYMKTEDYENARRHLDIALSKDHEEIILSYEADCELKFLTGQYTDCLRACEHLLERDPHDYVAYLFKAKACKAMNYIQEAYNACEQAINLYPYLSQPYALEASLFIRAHQYEQAQDTIKRFDAFENESDSIDYYRARLSMLDSKIDPAIRQLVAIVSRSDGKTTDMEHFEDVHMLLALCYRYKGMYDKALEQFEQVKKQNTQYPLIDMYIGSSYAKLGKIEQALEAFGTQLAIQATAQVYNERAIVYSLMGEYKKAVRDYQAALQLEPDNYFAYLRIGMIQELHKSYKAAADAYRKAYEVSETDTEQHKESLQSLARVYQCMNWFSESQQLYINYKKQYEWNADIAYDYAVLLVRMDAAKDAIAELLPFVDDSACARKLLDIYGDAGFIDLAHETFEYIISKDPENHWVYGAMGDIFRDHAMYADAKPLYERAIALDTNKEANYYSEWLECMIQLKELRSFKKNSAIANAAAAYPKDQIQTPPQYIKMARFARLSKNYKECKDWLEQGLHARRCRGCFYGVCHRILYEKALLYEKQRNYAMARSMYEEAIRVCGQNAFYEACLKRIEDKK